MTPELALIVRLALLSALVLGLEFLMQRRSRTRQKGQGRQLFVQPNPVVRLNLTPLQSRRSEPVTAQPDHPTPSTPIVRLEPLPQRASHVSEKRAA
jgi:hypothetical protein